MIGAIDPRYLAPVRTHLAAAALLGALVMLQGCAGPGPVAAPATTVTAVAGDPAFELAGRLAIRQGEQALSANLRWRYDGLGEEMVISAPLGAGSVEIERDAAGVTLRAGGKVERASSAETLMRGTLGFALPLDGLRYWVRGQTGPGDLAVRIVRDATGRIESFHESGWDITIPAFSAAPLDALPRRIDIASSALQVRLVIDRWQLLPAMANPAGAGKQP
jgi:outer membrane lipoprotein LolB